MHSTQMTRIARALDEMSMVVVALIERPASEGTYPAAWVVGENPDRLSERRFNFWMAVMPNDDDGPHGDPNGPCFLQWGVYDVTRESAMHLLTEQMDSDLRGVTT